MVQNSVPPRILNRTNYGPGVRTALLFVLRTVLPQKCFQKCDFSTLVSHYEPSSRRAGDFESEQVSHQVLLQ